MILKKNDPQCIATISDYVLSGNIVIIPTDTVYGFSGLPVAHTKEKLALIKKRDKNKSLINLIEKKEEALRYIDKSYYSNNELKELLSFWPCPLTIIFISSNQKEKTIALRCPKDAWLKKLLSNIGSSIFSTSVNISGYPSMKNLSNIKEAFYSDVSLIVDGGNLTSTSSTILDATKRPFSIIRQGSYILPHFNFYAT